jgi:hypothetical protein
VLQPTSAQQPARVSSLLLQPLPGGAHRHPLPRPHPSWTLSPTVPRIRASHVPGRGPTSQGRSQPPIKSPPPPTLSFSPYPQASTPPPSNPCSRRARSPWSPPLLQCGAAPEVRVEVRKPQGLLVDVLVPRAAHRSSSELYFPPSSALLSTAW